MHWRQTRRRHGRTRDDARHPACAPAGPRPIEPLESRRLLSATPLTAPATDACLAHPAVSAPAATTSDVRGYTPYQIAHAYGFDQVTLASGVRGDGAGQTIAIVDAYHDPNIAADLSAFDRQFGVQDAPTFKVVDQSGGTDLPRADAGWAGEIALDVEWAHAMAPGAGLLLVEARSNARDDLLQAVDYARNAPGVSVVSLSWGTGEFATESSFDQYFTTPAGHGGVTFVAASGDGGPTDGPYWPAVSGNVLSVGGTSLTLSDADGTYATEAGWTGTSGGASQYEARPAYQTAVVSAPATATTVHGPAGGILHHGVLHHAGTDATNSPNGDEYVDEYHGRPSRAAGGAAPAGGRAAPDVGYNADPRTGYAVYNSFSSGPFGRHGSPQAGGWQVVGGTSAGAPQWAALVAIANQGRALNDLPALDGAAAAGGTIAALYAAYLKAADGEGFHDVVGSGAGTGYDGATGLGSPKAGAVVAALGGGTATVVVGENVPPPPPVQLLLLTGSKRRLRPQIDHGPPPGDAQPPPPAPPQTVPPQGVDGPSAPTGPRGGAEDVSLAAAAEVGWSRSGAVGSTGSPGGSSDNPSAPAVSAAARAQPAAPSAMVASSGHSPDAGAAPSRVGGVSPGEALAAAPVPTPVLFAAGPAIAAGATDAADAGRAVANVAANAVPGAVAALPHLALGLAARAGDWLSAAGAALSAASPVQGAAEGGGPSALIALPKGAMFLGLGSIVPQAADPSAARVWKVTAAVSLAAMLVGYGYCKIDEQRRREEREEQEDRRRRAGRWLVLAGDPGRYE